MTAYTMTNHITGELYEASFRILYHLGNQLMRQTLRDNEVCWLELHTTKLPYQRSRPIAVFIHRGKDTKPVHMIFSRG